MSAPPQIAPQMAPQMAPRAAPQHRAEPTDPGFGVYVHWPFCLSKCPYCDFNSHVRETVAYSKHLVRER